LPDSGAAAQCRGRIVHAVLTNKTDAKHYCRPPHPVLHRDPQQTKQNRERRRHPRRRRCARPSGFIFLIVSLHKTPPINLQPTRLIIVVCVLQRCSSSSRFPLQCCRAVHNGHNDFVRSLLVSGVLYDHICRSFGGGKVPFQLPPLQPGARVEDDDAKATSLSDRARWNASGATRCLAASWAVSIHNGCGICVGSPPRRPFVVCRIGLNRVVAHDGRWPCCKFGAVCAIDYFKPVYKERVVTIATQRLANGGTVCGRCLCAQGRVCDPLRRMGTTLAPLVSMVNDLSPTILPCATVLSLSTMAGASLFAYCRPQKSLLSWVRRDRGPVWVVGMALCRWFALLSRLECLFEHVHTSMSTVASSCLRV